MGDVVKFKPKARCNPLLEAIANDTIDTLMAEADNPLRMMDDILSGKVKTKRVGVKRKAKKAQAIKLGKE